LIHTLALFLELGESPDIIETTDKMGFSFEFFKVFFIFFNDLQNLTWDLVDLHLSNKH